MSDEKQRLKNLKWFADLKLILMTRMVTYDETIEAIWQLTKKEFKR